MNDKIRSFILFPFVPLPLGCKTCECVDPCEENDCAKDEKCTPEPKACIRSPCPQYRCDKAQPEIPEDCAVWFDGCNTCKVADGKLGVCTEMACLHAEEPRCVETVKPPCSNVMCAQYCEFGFKKNENGELWQSKKAEQN